MIRSGLYPYIDLSSEQTHTPASGAATRALYLGGFVYNIFMTARAAAAAAAAGGSESSSDILFGGSLAVHELLSLVWVTLFLSASLMLFS